MRDVVLKLDEGTNTVLATVVEADGEITEIPLTTVKETPMTKIPVVVSDPTERLAQELLNTLMNDMIRGQPEEWWQGYYLSRLQDAVKYADEIAAADAEFRINAHQA